MAAVLKCVVQRNRMLFVYVIQGWTVVQIGQSIVKIVKLIISIITVMFVRVSSPV